MEPHTSVQRHLMIAVSGHGFGHLAQISSVLVNLIGRENLKITLRTPIDRVEVLSFLGLSGSSARVSVEPLHPEVGMVMHDSTTIDIDGSHRAYCSLHSEWESLLAAEIDLLTRAKPDLILADVPYLILAAADQLSIPTMAVCSLNWAEIYQHYCGSSPEADAIVATIREAYASVECFLLPQPSMPMDWLPQRRPVGALARIGVNRRDLLIRKGVIGSGQPLAIVALGGIPHPMDGGAIAPLEGIRVAIPASWRPRAERGQIAIESIGLPFIDLLASCDTIVAKSGYGTFVEAACNGTALLHPPRSDWPEAPWLESWIAANGRSRVIDSLDLLQSGGLKRELEALFNQPMPARPTPAGGREIANLIAERLCLSGSIGIDRRSIFSGLKEG